MSEILDIRNVSIDFSHKKLKKVRVLDDISLHLNKGEIMAVVGESGCGKTTLGKIIVGLHAPTEGSIIYDGKDVKKITSPKDYKAYRLGVQIVHQDSFAALNPNRTIFQSLSLPLLQNKFAANRSEAEIILKESFREVGLIPEEQFLYKFPHQLSGGQRQRILLARILSIKPKLVVADEPVSMVDVSLRVTLINLMADMNKKYDISFVYITHDLATARYIARNGKLAVMYLGKLIELNNIHDAIENPMHPYFHVLLAAVPEKIGAKHVSDLPLRSLDMPSITNPPTGCRFHPRCLYYTERCIAEEPLLRKVGSGYVACHIAEQIAEERMKNKKLGV